MSGLLGWADLFAASWDWLNHTDTSMGWQERWKLPEGAKVKRGGNSTVQQVIGIEDGAVGALKILDPDKQDRKERVFRMKTEVAALRAMSIGVPKLLDTNVESSAPDEPLFMVMEWVQGSTLQEIVVRRSLSLDEALDCSCRILRTLAAMHQLPIVHRDLKPDNVMLRGSAASDPVIIDLGLAWKEADDAGFETPIGQEVGNRFLRLPEFAPGRISRDSRSDVTLACGLLLFMISGKQPRVLLDEKGRAPHEALGTSIPSTVTQDKRWPRLSRLFFRGFQSDLEQRFANCEQLLAALANLAPTSAAEANVQTEIEHLKSLMESTSVARKQSLQKAIRSLGEYFAQEVREALRSSDLKISRLRGAFHENTYRDRIALSGPSGILCTLRHEVTLLEQKIVASFRTDKSSATVYFDGGPVSDIGALEEKIPSAAQQASVQALRVCMQKLSR